MVVVVVVAAAAAAAGAVNGSVIVNLEMGKCEGKWCSMKERLVVRVGHV